MKRVGITEKRLANKRFRRTEGIILRAFFASSSDAGMIGIAKKAGVARSTIYIHHRTAREIIPDYERYVLKKYRKMMKKILAAKNSRLETVFIRTLIFMTANKRFFAIILRNDNAIIEKMLDEIEIKIVSSIRISRNRECVFKIYRSEVAVLIDDWCKKNFSYEEIDKVVENIIYLTKTARIRLGVLK